MARNSHPNGKRSASRDGSRKAIRLQAVLLRGATQGFEFLGPHGQQTILPAAVAATFLRGRNLNRVDRTTVDFWLQRWRR